MGKRLEQESGVLLGVLQDLLHERKLEFENEAFDLGNFSGQRAVLILLINFAILEGGAFFMIVFKHSDLNDCFVEDLTHFLLQNLHALQHC